MEYEKDLQEALAVIRNHGVILYPGDTIWGLGCDVSDELAVQRLFEIKQRDVNKRFVILMTDTKQLMKYLADPPPDLSDILTAFSRPTTVVYSHAINLPDSIISEDGTVAIRLTKDPFCRSLIKRLRQPIVSTSANVSGKASPQTFSDIDEEIKSRADYVVKWRQEEVEPQQASDIFKLDSQGNLHRLR